jgi:hypothetical protein
MNTIWLTLVLCAITFSYFLLRKSKRPDLRCTDAVWASALVGTVGFLVAFVVVPSFLPYHTIALAPVRLAAMRSSDGLNGTFVLGSGSISSQTTYHFYIRNQDGSVTPETLSASKLVRLVEDASLKGEGFWTTIQQEKDFSSPLAKWAINQNDWTSIVGHEFRVPVGTVVTKFNVE